MARAVDHTPSGAQVNCDHVKNRTAGEYAFLPIGEETTLGLCRDCWERIRAVMVLDTVERTMKQAWKSRGGGE